MEKHRHKLGSRNLRAGISGPGQTLCFFVIVALAIFTVLFNNVTAVAQAQGQSNDVGAIIQSMIILLGYTFALIMTVFRTGAISKSIFGAH